MQEPDALYRSDSAVRGFGPEFPRKRAIAQIGHSKFQVTACSWRAASLRNQRSLQEQVLADFV